MSHLTTAISIIVFLAADIALIWAILNVALRLGWNDLATRFPARDPAPDAVSRNFQSIAIGIANYGLCATIAVDDAALHVRPPRFLRHFGARGFSVPWDQVRFKKKRKVLGKVYVEVLIGKTSLTGPEWCLGLAEPPAGGA